MPAPTPVALSDSRGPRLAVRLPHGPAIAGFLSPTWPPLPEPAARVWPAERRLWSWGPWHPGEVSTAECARARLLAVGQCLADARTMREDLERATRDGRWERLTQWPGAYLLVVIHDGDRLTAYVDPAGQFPLYYAQRGDRTALSTRATAAAVLAGTGGAADATALAAQIVCPGVPELTEARSAFAHVRRLGGGEALRIEPSGVLTHWTYERLSPDSGADFKESAARLRSSLTRAVTLRADGPRRVTSDFSGGMDSTSLAFLAARGATEPLDAFVYHHPDASAGDLEHALHYAAETPAVRLDVTRGTLASLPYRGLESQGPMDQPDPAAVTGSRLRLRLAHIARDGGSVHLTGEGGDALLAVPPAYLGDLAAAVGLRRLAHDARALARLRQLSPARVAFRALRLAHTPADRALRELAVLLENPVQRPTQWLDAVAWWSPPGPEAAWLTTRARRHLAELARERSESASGDPLLLTPGTRAVLCDLRNSAAVQGQFTSIAREFGVWPQAPFLDSEVVRACTSLPLPLKADPFTVKPLLAAGLAGLVPDPVLRRRTKGDYAAEDYWGARLSAAELRARLVRSPLADLGIIEPSRVIASLDRAVAGLSAPFPALNRLLGADMWLACCESGEELP